MTFRSIVTICLALFPFLVAGCGDDGDGKGAQPTASPTATVTPGIVEELLAAGLAEYLDIAPPTARQNGTWEEYVYDTADETAICLRGTPYQVNLRRGSSDKVLFYMEGGGACWNTQTCWGGTPTAKLTANSAPPIGILDASNEDNPFRDWNIVYASYCDGSVFAGNNIVDYDGNRTYHHGLQNTSAAVALIRQEFPDAAEIVVSGSSAGGFGTYTGYGVTRVAFPDTTILVLNDSGPGTQNPDDVGALVDREENWRFREVVPASCENCDVQLSYLTNWSIDRDPTLRVGYFNYLQDPVLQFFLALDAEGFETLLLDVTDDMRTRSPERFKRYFKQGSVHTVLLSPELHTLAVRGLSLLDWISDFLDDGPKWEDTVE